MATPALAVRPTAGFVQVPSSFVENQAAFIPAERALALTLFRRVTDDKGHTNLRGTATISDRTWEKWTGLQPRMKELAIKGLREKGLMVDGRGDTAKFSWDWERWNNALAEPKRSDYDPKRKEREQRAAANKVHPDCATGCAKLRELEQANKTGLESKTPLLVTSIAQPVAQQIQVSAPKPAAQRSCNSLSDTEAKWTLTLAAMRSQFASVGVDLLVRLLAVVVSFVKMNLSDYVLAEAVKEAYADSRGRWESPILLLKTVPNVLKTWKDRGQPMDDPGDPEGYTYLSERGKHPPDYPDSKPSRGDEKLMNRMANARRILDLADKKKTQ